MTKDPKEFKIVRDDGSVSIASLRPIRNNAIYDTEVIRDLDKWVTFFDKPLGHYFVDPKPPRKPKTSADTNLMHSRALIQDDGIAESYVDFCWAGVKSKLHLPEQAPVSVLDSFVHFAGEKITIEIVAEDDADRAKIESGSFQFILSNRNWLECPTKLLLPGAKNPLKSTFRMAAVPIKFCEKFYARMKFLEDAEIRNPVTIRVLITGTLWSPI